MDEEVVVRVPGWERYGWLRHGFSTRWGGASSVYGSGEMNLGFTKEDDAETVRGNRARFVEEVATGARFDELVTVRQVHGDRVRRVAAGEVGIRTADVKATEEADGLMSDAAGVMLGIQVADCVPVLLADTRLRAVAAIHAGWRGTAAGIVEEAIAGMRREFGSRAEDLVGAVGPSIGACCYVVGEEVRAGFAARFAYADELFAHRDGGMVVDLWEANRRQMVGAGLRAEAVTVVGECTGCTRVDGRRKYFSHRVDKGVTGRAMGMIGVVGC